MRSPVNSLDNPSNSHPQAAPVVGFNVVNLAVRRHLKRGSCSQQSRALINVIDALAELSKVSGEARKLVRRAEILLARSGR